MADLRPSQVETLRVVAEREGKHGIGLSADGLAASLRITWSAAERRLLRLAEADVLWWDGAFGRDGGQVYISRSTYRLTDKGKAALAATKKGAE